MADTGNIDVPESSSQPLRTTATKVWKFWSNWFKIYILKKNIYLEGLNFEKFFCGIWNFFWEFPQRYLGDFTWVGQHQETRSVDQEERGIWRRDSRQPPFLRRVALEMRMSFGGNNGGICTCAVRLTVLYKRLATKQLNMSLFISSHRKILQSSYNWLCSICRPFY